MKKAAGFTLVELMVSVSIFSVLTTVGLLTFQRNQATQQLRDSANLLQSSIRKIQGYTRAGRGVISELPPNDFFVPRAYGVSFNFEAVAQPTEYRLYADRSSGEYYCFRCPLVSDDTQMEVVQLADNVVISQMELVGGDPIVPAPTRIDLVFTLPNAEMKLLWQDPADEALFYDYLPTVNDYISLVVTLLHQRSGESEKIEIWGGPLGGVINLFSWTPAVPEPADAIRLALDRPRKHLNVSSRA